jgi:hypothetical protein
VQGTKNRPGIEKIYILFLFTNGSSSVGDKYMYSTVVHSDMITTWQIKTSNNVYYDLFIYL